jgi:hypothetical protein
VQFIYYTPPVVDVIVPVVLGQNPSGSSGASLGAKPASAATIKLATIGSIIYDEIETITATP